MSAGIVRVHGAAVAGPVALPALGAVGAPVAFAKALAAANAWSVCSGRWPEKFGCHDFKREILPLIDHYTLFRDRASRRVVAVLSHDYNGARDFAGLGDLIVVDRLPFSAYSAATTAFVLRVISNEERRAVA